MPSSTIDIQLIRDESPFYYEAAEKHGGLFWGIQWRRIYYKNVEVYGIYNKNRLCGGFMLYRSKRVFLTMLTNPPFMPSFGPWLIKKEYSNFQKQRDFERSVYTEIAKFLDQQRVKIKTLVLHPAVRDVLPFFWKQFKISPQLTYRIDLTHSPDEIKKNLSGDKRNLISKSKRKDYQAVITYDYRKLEEQTKSYLDRKNIKVNPELLHHLFYEFANRNNSFGVMVKKDETVLSFGFFVHDKRECYYLFGGNLINGDNSSGTFVLWKAIEQAKNKNIRWFDFEGSIIPNVERYFSGFGGVPIDYYRINKASLFLEILLKFFKRNIF